MNEEEHTHAERWKVAVARARVILGHYREIPEGAFGAMMIQSDLTLYEAGDHSEALLERIERIK